VPDEFIWEVFAQFQYAKWHTYQVLTKQPKRMLQLVTKYIAEGKSLDSSTPFPFANVWWGVTAENQTATDERIPLLLQTPAAVRFVSVEPMLGQVNLHLRYDGVPLNEWGYPLGPCGYYCDESVGHVDHNTRLDWIILGSQTGPQRQDCPHEFMRSLLRQCTTAAIRAFVKQINIDGRVSKDPDEWPKDLRVRDFPEARS
jgi:protein gp37